MRWRRKRLGTSFFIYMKTSFANGVCTECAAYSIHCVDYIFISTYCTVRKLFNNNNNNFTFHMTSLRERRAEQDFFTLRECEESSRDSLRRVPVT